MSYLTHEDISGLYDSTSRHFGNTAPSTTNTVNWSCITSRWIQPNYEPPATIQNPGENPIEKFQRLTREYIDAYRFEPLDVMTLNSITRAIEAYCISQFGSGEIGVHQDFERRCYQLTVTFPFGGQIHRFMINLGDQDYIRTRPTPKVEKVSEMFDDPELFKVE